MQNEIARKKLASLICKKKTCIIVNNIKANKVVNAHYLKEKMMQYSVLIMDVVKSKRYDSGKRQALQDLIGWSLEYLNKLFESEIEVPVSFSGGDEVQGMFTSCGGAFLYFRLLSLILGKGVMRGGIGRGGWNVKVAGASSASQDGEAYHRARQAINFVHKNRIYDVWFDLGDGADEIVAILADHSLGLIDMRTDNQNDIALYHEMISPVSTAAEVANDCEDAKIQMLKCRGFMRDAERSSRRKYSDINIGDIVYAEGPEEPIPLLSAKHRGEWELPPRSRSKSYFVEILAHALGKSRQNIEDQIKRARIYQERNAAAFFVYYCEKYRL